MESKPNAWWTNLDDCEANLHNHVLREPSLHDCCIIVNELAFAHHHFDRGHLFHQVILEFLHSFEFCLELADGRVGKSFNYSNSPTWNWNKFNKQTILTRKRELEACKTKETAAATTTTTTPTQIVNNIQVAHLLHWNSQRHGQYQEWSPCLS